MAKRIAQMSLAIVVCAFASATSLPACTCAPPPVDDLFTRASRVFYGTVTSLTYIDKDTPDTEPRIRVRFTVHRDWKGGPDELVLQTVYNKISCDGYFFAENKSYLVFAFKTKAGALSVGLCTVFSDGQENEKRFRRLDELKERASKGAP